MEKSASIFLTGPLEIADSGICQEELFNNRNYLQFRHEKRAQNAPCGKTKAVSGGG